MSRQIKKCDCPECGAYGGHTLRVDRSDGEDRHGRDYLTVQQCHRCGHDIARSALRLELPEGERRCKGYSCRGKIVEYLQDLWRCDSCDRIHVRTVTTRGTVYPTSACACCETTRPLDFHHWNYNTGVGVYICRECHEYIHNGLTATEQAKQSPKGESWEFEAIRRLKDLHEEYHGEVRSHANFEDRYNLP